MGAGDVLSFGEKSLGKETTGKPKCRWEDNIKKDPQDVG